MYKKLVLVSLCLLTSLSHAESTVPVIRLGVLAFGTVNWEIEAMKQANLMDTSAYQLKITSLANPQAGKIALQSGAVDMIISDWVWVSYQRSLGRQYRFYPYSNTTGGLVVAADSAIKNLADLKGKKIAIVGGVLDKNGLLLKALMSKQGLEGIFDGMEKMYGAPPLLMQQLKKKRVDALLTYWHYAARMEAKGYKVLMNGADIMQGLGIKEKVPSIGYVFQGAWAEKNRFAVQHFLDNSQSIKNSLCSEETLWRGIKPLIRAKTASENTVLRERYCAGRVLAWGDAEKKSAETIYSHLKSLSGQRLTGTSETIQSGTFW